MSIMIMFSMCIHRKTNQKKFADLNKNFVHFQNFHKFNEIRILMETNIWNFINLPWGRVRSHTKFGPDRFSRFDVYWIQTNIHPDKLNLYKTRLLGRFSPIFYLNCEHVLFVYILKQRRRKFCGFKRKFQELKFFTKLKTFKTLFFNFYHL